MGKAEHILSLGEERACCSIKSQGGSKIDLPALRELEPMLLVLLLVRNWAMVDMCMYNMTIM